MNKNIKKYDTAWIIIGTLFALWGILLAVISKNPHFYTPFSLGFSIIFLIVHRRMEGRNVFGHWPFKSFVVFFTLLIFASIAIDITGLQLGYWTYPHYSSLFDDILKYIFEWAAALFYIFMSFVIGADVFEKMGIRKSLAHILSLVIFVTLAGFVTEFLNLYMYSWQILKMPFTNWNINGYFIVFQTLGYWSMALVTYAFYFVVERVMNHHKIPRL